MRLVTFLALSFLLIACSKAELTPEEVQAVQTMNQVEDKAATAATPTPPSVAPATEPKEKGAQGAAPAAAAALKGTAYGSGVTLPESVSIADLKANIDTYVGKEVRVEGLITGVCPKRGCWFDMAGEKSGESMRFKVRDGVMVFPMEANGKYAVAQGKVRKMPMTLEQSKRWATYQRDSYGADIDPDTITEPLTIVRLDGSGAMIRDAK